MKKNYTLNEIKAELFHEIDALEEMDPFWKRCRHCPYHGKCCIDNDIDIREDEWEEISSFLDTHPIERKLVRENLLSGSKCYFRVPEKCLIHEIRPTNCIYTPYQALQNLYDHHLYYSSVSETCEFTEREISYPKQVPSKMFLKIDKEGHVYLLLNYWYLNFEDCSSKKEKKLAEERLKAYFHLD